MSDWRQEQDGTWTVTLRPWTDKVVRGLPSQKAEAADDAIEAAMKAYARNAMTED